jgi:quinoprotein glucose dehydrogenase
LREAGLRLAVILGVALAPATLNAQAIPGALPDSTAALSRGEWPAYAGTYAAARYSPLAQIDPTNARDLHIAWRWKSPDMAIKASDPKVGPSVANESTPLMIGGTLYTSTSLSEVAAIDAASGETKWVFDPKIYQNGLGLPANLGWLHRGVAYWRNGDDERIVILTAFAQMIALDARTGKPMPTFGTEGRLDLSQGLRRLVDRDYYTMTSPPVIVHGVIVVGSSVMDWWGTGRRRRAMSEVSTSIPGACSGSSIPLPKARSPASRPGRRIHGRKSATPMSGRRSARTRNLVTSICRSARRPTTITAATASAMASTARASFVSM